MSDLAELKSRLNGNVQAVAAHLLPGGRREGREWVAGSVAGEKGQSLKVHLDGEKAGVWQDFATGQGGDIVDLWRETRNLGLKETLDEIRAFLGVQRPRFEGEHQARRKTFRKPEKPACTAPKARVRDYLTEDRNLPEASIAAYRVAEADGGQTIVFPFLKGKELAFVKYLNVNRDERGKKVTRVEPGCRPVLFGWQAIPDDAREVVICEGEIDALSWHAYGFPALSVPFGAGTGAKHAWIAEEFEDLERFEVIHVAMDMDDEGRAAAADISSRLGRHRCRIVELPHKDANECLQNGVPAETMARAIRVARTLDPEELRAAETFADAVVNAFYPGTEGEPGHALPWRQAQGKVLFRPGEVSVWQGATGVGKSQALSHACLGFMEQGARVCIASLEMAPAMLLRRMVRQATGTGRPTQPYIRAVFDWLAGRLWLFSVVGKSKVDRLLEVFEYARRRFGVDVFAVDSFMRLGIGPDDYRAQEEAVFKLVDWTVGTGVHLHLVAHSRKADAKAADGAPATEDIKGTSEIGANAFNVIGVWRNRKHEEKLAEARTLAETGSPEAARILAELEAKPGVVLHVSKQRNGDWEGRLPLHFDPESYQYRGSGDPAMLAYVHLARGAAA